MQIAGRIVIAILALAAVAACGVVTTLAMKPQFTLVPAPDADDRLDDRDNLALDFQVPGRARLISHDDEGVPVGNEELARDVIDEELSDADPEEREIWHAELKQHPPETIREILQLSRHFSGKGKVAAAFDVKPASSEGLPPRLLNQEPRAVPLTASADELSLVESAIEAVYSGEQVILNNVANANTIGFKRNRPLFADLPPRQLHLPGQIDQQGRPTTTGTALGAGVSLSATQIDLTQGRLRHTHQQLDLAIQGDGYFQINDGAQFSYTRKGTFGVNANGEIVLTSSDQGRPLEPAITIPQDTVRIEISTEGIVSVAQAGRTQTNQIGQIQLARFINPQGLIAIGADRFQQTAASGNPLISIPLQDGLGEIRQGYLEESNVVIADEMAELRRLREQLKALLQLQAEAARGTP